MDKETIERSEEAISMAGYAEQVLSNPAHKRAFAHLKKDLELKFMACSATDVESLQEIKRMFSALERLEKAYLKMLEDGKVAKNRLQKFLDRMRKK